MKKKEDKNTTEKEEREFQVNEPSTSIKPNTHINELRR